ncbi:PAS domain S-box protein [Candidatus Albibeggiatoa sp. nov. NOAA]|uniref:PAS domain S-box protein n=1 Tax=Candidatus Albibeggiatoa sp. nov. NOAA TaxID=3162724 RepID=UPI0032F30E8A|nr:PAS domain S-box protein [Thiotrichaceae bacterium]
MSKPVIVCVDDEYTILDSLKIELKKALGNDYLIETAEDGEEAIELFEDLIEEQSDIPLIISDYLMPNMKGDEVLKEIHQLSPKTLKVMLTGQADINAVGNAIKHAKLYRYISKPWEAEDLRLTVKEAIHSYQQEKRVSEQHQILEALNREQAELIQKLQVSEAQTRAIVLAAADGIITVNMQGIIEMINPALETMFGYTQKELIGQNVSILMPADIAQQHDGFLEAYTQTGKKHIIDSTRELEGRRKNGETFPLELSVREAHLGSRQLFVGILHDITERKQAEAILRLTQHSVNYAADSILWVNQTGQILYANDSAACGLDYTQDELLTKNISDIDISTTAEAWQEYWGYLINQGSLSFESQYEAKNGQVFPVETTLNYLEYDNKAYAFAFTRDITERKQAEEERLKAAYEIFQLNKAYERFVPSAFLSLLDKASIVEVELGDQVKKEMTVLFSDIRGFTPLSEQMSPKEVFDFINIYLSRMEPIILEYQGVIDKYIGDAIMALFPKSADDAIQGSVQMLKTLVEHNKRLAADDLPQIQIGIGLNTGPLILGTIGGKNRMEGTVIADAVNLSARVESLTKIYGTPLLITEYTHLKLANPHQYHIRVIDAVQVKGKSYEVTVYEIYDADSPEIIQLKDQTLEDFETGFLFYHIGKFEYAQRLFQNVLEINPQDKAAQVYINRIEQHFSDC